jgi:general stress protein YciG
MGSSTSGFAAMTPERRREVAAKGGRAVNPENRTFFTDRKLASEAGAKGGQNLPDEKRSFKKWPLLAAEAGRKGGKVKKVKP